MKSIRQNKTTQNTALVAEDHHGKPTTARNKWIVGDKEVTNNWNCKFLQKITNNAVGKESAKKRKIIVSTDKNKNRNRKTKNPAAHPVAGATHHSNN